MATFFFKYMLGYPSDKCATNEGSAQLMTCKVIKQGDGFYYISMVAPIECNRVMLYFLKIP